MKAVFSTKAGTLASLQEKITTATIAPIRVFSAKEWWINREKCLENLEKDLQSDNWIVRSSCIREDQENFSNAGAFLSLLNIGPDDLENAVIRVMNSYGDPEKTDEILIQPMLQNVIRSGVAFSHDPNTNSPYRVINWSDGNDTSSITQGMEGRVWYQASETRTPAPPNLDKVLELLDELLFLFDQTPLECEFAYTKPCNGQSKKEVLWLLQVRPLIMARSPEPSEFQTKRLKTVENKLKRGMQPHPFLMGDKNVYGVMPDWNPAEIIGIRPKPLALSLYRELVTDSIWAYQRHNYGYRNLRSFPLMPHFFGLPYIDVRLSFNSFIPANLSDDLAHRLVDYYVDRLVSEPTLHDKIEFEIVFSCYSLDLQQRLKKLLAAGFTNADCEELSESLRDLTNRIIHPTNGLWLSDAKKLEDLKRRRINLNSSNADILDRIYWLLEDGKRYGTLPFAGLARAGFIGVQMLRSFVSMGLLSESDYHKFIRGISTVSQDLIQDRKSMAKNDFIEKYGHLRPGSYDILSPRYDEAPDLYFDWETLPNSSNELEAPVLGKTSMKEIEKVLNTHGLLIEAEDLINFIKNGIELRELSKFHFTRNLSDVLSLITEYASDLSIKKEDIAFSNIRVFQEIHIAGLDPKEAIIESIELGRKNYEQTSRLSLPPLITKPEDVWGFEWPKTVPNFVTQKQVSGTVCAADPKQDLTDKIICILNADPGFDWLFSHPIAGLITAWGGPNSHMAIRAGELGLPALIGTGEPLYQKLSSANVLYLDCAGKRVEVIS